MVMTSNMLEFFDELEAVDIRYRLISSTGPWMVWNVQYVQRRAVLSWIR